MTSIGENFYFYVNQKWLDTNVIPPGYSRWSRFNELADKTLEQTHKLLDEIKDVRLQKLISLFNSYDYSKEKEFHQELLDLVSKVESKNDLLKLYQSKLSLFGVRFLYCVDVESDMKNSSKNILYLEPSGLVLPGRDYYLETQFEDKRDKYVEFINKLGSFVGLDLDGKSILDFETKLAELHLKPEEKRNPDNVYFPVDFEKVQKEMGIPLEIYFDLLGKKPGKIVLTNEKYFEKFSSIIEETDIELLKKYMKYKLVLSFGSFSKGEFYDLYFDFFGKVLSGKKEQLPLWKRLVSLIDVSLGEILGNEYVLRYFSSEAKEEVSDMIKYFKEILKDIITNSKWMEEETKTKALEKLESMRYKIGYPNKFEDFKGLSFEGLTSLSEVMSKIREWWVYRSGRELYEEVDREKWEMLPHQVNAYYHPLLNEIVFPAAILQPPFFSLEMSKEENYGGIGVVIAHEITHGFDDQGKIFDAQGNLNNWWTKKDEEKFNEESSKLVRQFDELELFDTKLNGKLTLGENLADLGGVSISFEALTRKYPELSEDEIKQFFMSYARIWANLCSCEEGQKLVKTDPHSPGIYRVNGILPHVEAFYKYFNITETDKMFLKKEDRCNIWSL